MPLPVAHGLLGATIVAAFHPYPTQRSYSLPLLVGTLVANAADIDFILVYALHSKSWHRGFTHSVVFALLACVLTSMFLGKRQTRVALVYGLVFASHGLLDYLTSKEGGGVEVLWPFSTERMKLGWWGLSEASSKLPVSGIMIAITIEFVMFMPLLIAVLLVRKQVTHRVVTRSQRIR